MNKLVTARAEVRTNENKTYYVPALFRFISQLQAELNGLKKFCFLQLKKDAGIEWKPDDTADKKDEKIEGL